MRTISCKSTKENYRKESLGLKKNTIRKFDDDDQRKAICDSYINGEFTDISIIIINKDDLGKESFRKDVLDITKWEGIYIISWM